MKRTFRGFTAIIVCITLIMYISINSNDPQVREFIRFMIMFSAFLTSCVIGMHYTEIQKFFFRKNKDKIREAKRIEAVKPHKRILAVHEAGHAIVAAALLSCIKPIKISIIPKGTALGRVEYADVEKPIWSKKEYMSLIARSYAGRVAEEIIFGETFSTSVEDMSNSTAYAHKFVNIYAMSGKLVTEIDYPEFNEILIAENMEAVDKVCREAYTLAENTLRQNMEALLKLVDVLIEKETIFEEEIDIFMHNNNVYEESKN